MQYLFFTCKNAFLEAATAWVLPTKLGTAKDEGAAWKTMGAAGCWSLSLGEMTVGPGSIPAATGCALLTTATTGAIHGIGGWRGGGDEVGVAGVAERIGGVGDMGDSGLLSLKIGEVVLSAMLMVLPGIDECGSKKLKDPCFGEILRDWDRNAIPGLLVWYVTGEMCGGSEFLLEDRLLILGWYQVAFLRRRMSENQRNKITFLLKVLPVFCRLVFLNLQTIFFKEDMPLYARYT